MRMRLRVAVLLNAAALCGAVLGWPLASTAQSPGPGAWLEQSTPDNWNQLGAAVPTAPPPDIINPHCGGDQERPSESPEEDQVVGAGWRLFNAAQVGWGLRLVNGLVSYDGMCRPMQFEGFVFADGQFAGTISPQPMDSRIDGVGRVLDVRGKGNLTGQ